ncbi:MAG: TonB family protein [Bacteroidota bacterium]
MKHCIILWSVLLLSNYSFAQDTTYYDNNWQIANEKTAFFYSILDHEGSHWVRRNFFLSNDQLQSVEYFGKGDLKQRIDTMKAWYEGGEKQKLAIYNLDGSSHLTYWYENGQLKQRGNVTSRGSWTGNWESYFDNGQLKESGVYEEGGKLGRWEYWYRNGKPHQVREYVHSEQIGIEIKHLNFWDREGNHLLRDGNGYIKEVYGDDQSITRFEGQVKGKKRIGLWNCYYPSGEIAEKVRFDKKGQATGVHKYFYPDGEVEMQGEMAEGIRKGKWIYCSKNGTIIWENTYEGQLQVPYVFGWRDPIPLNMSEVSADIGYPKLARDSGIEGEVLIRLLLDEDGKYIRHRVIQSSHPILAQAVEIHINKLYFIPGREHNTPCKYWLNVPFNFHLK